MDNILHGWPVDHAITSTITYSIFPPSTLFCGTMCLPLLPLVGAIYLSSVVRCFVRSLVYSLTLFLSLSFSVSSAPSCKQLLPLQSMWCSAVSKAQRYLPV